MSLVIDLDKSGYSDSLEQLLEAEPIMRRCHFWQHIINGDFWSKFRIFDSDDRNLPT